MNNKKFQRKKKNLEKKAIQIRDELTSFLFDLIKPDYDKYPDLKGLSEEELQRIRNDVLKQIVNLSKRFNLNLTKEIKNHYCKKCGSFLIEGKNSKTRVHKSRIIRKCLVCGNMKRIPLK